jgi:peroxiredoxin
VYRPPLNLVCDEDDLGFAEKDIFAPGRVQIIGLSTDSIASQKNFVEKEGLTVGVFFMVFNFLVDCMTF